MNVYVCMYVVCMYVYLNECVSVCLCMNACMHVERFYVPTSVCEDV